MLTALWVGTRFPSAVHDGIFAECIAREDGIKVRRSTFESVFRDLCNFLVPGAKNCARLIAPLDMVRLDSRPILLGPDARVRRLTPSQTVDLVNHCPTLGLFYGDGIQFWFNTVLELDFTFEWLWLEKDEEEHDGLSRVRTRIQDSQRPVQVAEATG